MVNGGTSAVWGHAVSTALHTAATSSSTGGGGTSFAFRSTPSTVTLAHFPTHEPQDGHVASPSATCRDMSTRVLTLPDRHIVSCLSLHEDKEHHSLRSWIAVGTQDQGCYVFPLESERGVLVGDVPPAFESVYRSTTGASSAPLARGRDDDDTVFTLDNKWISKSTGSTTLAAAFVAAGSPSSSAAGDKSNAVASAPPAMLLALVTSTPPAPHREATASQPASALSVYVSLWGVEGALRKQLLWKSPALSHVAPHEVQGLQCGPSMWKSSSTFSATLAVCTRRGVSLWRAQVTPTTSAATSMGGGRSVSPSRASPSSPASPAATPPLLVEVKDRPCATIPELTGAEYVSLVVPPTPSSSSGSSGVVLALTISGFLVCYDLTDGSVVKWMDCKVCPASRLSCTDTHVIVSGATVRYFTLPAWEFGGKLSPPSLTDAVSGGDASTSSARGGGGLVASSVASSAGGGGFLEALMSGFAIGSVGGGRRGEWLATFYSSGALSLTHAAPSPTSKKAKKLTITKVYTLTPFAVPSTLRGASSTSLLAQQQQQQLAPSSLRHRPTTPSGPPRFLPTPRWSPVHLYWSAAAGLRSVCRETAAPLAYRDMESTCATLVRLPLPLNRDHHDSTTETTAKSITAVVAFDTTFHGLVVMDAMRHFAVIARLPLDTSAAVTSLIAVPLVSSSDGSEASVQNTDMKSGRSGATLFGVVPSDASHDQHVRNDAAVIRVDIELFDGDESLTTPANDAACLATVVQRIRREDCGGGDGEGDNIALLDDVCLRMTLRSCRPPRRPQESVERPEDGEEILQLATTESGAHVCAIAGRWVWNVRTGATLHLPVVPSAADMLPAVSSGERIFIAGRRAEGVETSSPHQQHLCVINPTDPADIRSYVFPIPAFTSAAAAIGGLQIDDDTKYVSVINDARDEIIVLNMRTKCSEINRVWSRDTSTIASSAAVFHTFALRGGRSEPPQLIVVTGDEGGTSAATLKMVSVAAADATALPSGVAGPSVGKRSPVPGAAAAVSPPTRSPPPQVPPTSAVAPQRHRDPTVPTSRAAPIASDRSRQQPTNAASTPTERARRAQSCGAEASTQRSPTTAAPLPQAGRAAAANAALSDKFNALQQAIAQNLTPAAIGAATRRQRGSSPPQPESDPAHRQPPAHHSDPNGAPPAAPTSSPASQLIGSRRQDPFRQSGLLLTPQVLENSRTGDVTLRLGMRWSDMTAGAGGVGMFELPVIRSHNSSICNNSAIDSSMEGVGILHAAMSAVAAGGGGVSTPAAARRPAVESALATELLMRRMHQREAANAAAATPSSSTTIAAVAATSPPHAVAPSRSIAAKDAPKAQSPPGVAKHAATGRYDTLALLDSADLLSPHAKTASTVTDAARGGGDSVVEDDELDITIARRLLAQERKRLDGNFIVGDPPSSPPAPPKEPTPSHKSPTRADDVHVGSAFDDPDTPSNLEENDFVVCGSIVGWPPSAHATGAPAGGPVVANSEPTFSKSPQRQPYEPDASDDDGHDGDHRRYARGRQGTADPSDFSKDSFDAELFGQQFRTAGPPPRAAFAGVLASVPANSSSMPMAASTSPSSPQPQHHSLHQHRSTVAPLETLRPSDARPQASSSTSTALRQQHRLDEIRRATEAVRRSIATLKDIILEDDGAAQDAVGIVGESSSLRDDGGDASASMREWNSVLNDVVTAMWATSQRASTSRPSTAMSSSALQRRPLTAGGAAANSDAVRGTRLTDLAQPAAVSALDITPLTLNTSSNSDGSTVDAAVASAASAAQFQLLWSEMQRMQAQNAELLAAVTRTSR